MENFYCHEINFPLPRNWDIHIKIQNGIYNCDTDYYFPNDFLFLESLLQTKHVEKLAIFKTIPSDITLWIDYPYYTLLIDKQTSSSGKVCRNTVHTITLETNDFPMLDWNVPFYIKGRFIPYNSQANIMLEKSTFWLFPLLNDKKTLKSCLNYLSQKSIIRSMDIRHQMSPNTLWSHNTTIKIQPKLETFLKNLQKTKTLKKTLSILNNLNYDWPNITNVHTGNFCSPVLWKETGPKRLKEPECSTLNTTIKNQVPMRADILLVIVYNNRNYYNMPYINNLYVKLFQYIAYCGPINIPTDYKGFFVGFKNYKGHATGVYGQTCSSIFLAMRHKHTKGLLISADDILLNTHLLSKNSLSNFWINNRGYLKDIRKIHKNSTGLLIYKRYKDEIMKALSDLYTTNNFLLRKCGESLENISGHRFAIRGGYSDIYYVPYSLANKFLVLNNHFLDNKITFEVAIPTIMSCLDRVEYLQTSLTHPSKRNRQWETLYKLPWKHFIHPVKWGMMMKRPENYKKWQNLYCRSRVYINDKSKDKKILNINNITK